MRTIRQLDSIAPIGISQFSATSILLRAAAFLPACYMLACVAAFAVNTPWWDEWEHVVWFQKLAQHNLTLRDLFAQQNEYRQFFPNLLFASLGWLSKGDFRLPIVVTLLLVSVISFNIYHLASWYPGTPPTARLAAYLAAMILVFSPVQYQNWLQGQQLIYFVPIACLTTGLLIVASSALGRALKFGLCALLCVISTFSSANGFLCWLLLLPLLVGAGASRSLRDSTWWIVGWVVAFAVSLAFYLQGYEKPAQHPSLFSVLAEPGSAAVYFLSVLGAPFAMKWRFLAAPIGALLLGTLACSLVWSWRHRHDNESIGATIPWLVIAAYAVLTALVITVGRAGFGIDQAFARRYTTFTLYLPVSLVFLAVTALAARVRRDLQPVPRLVARAPAILAALVVVYHVPVYLHMFEAMNEFQVEGNASKACALLANVVKDDCAKFATYADYDVFRNRVNVLAHLGFLDAPIVTTDNVRDLASRTTTSRDYGVFKLVATAGGEYVASGDAVLPHANAPAHLVLLAYDAGSATSRIFAVTRVSGERDAVSVLLGRPTYENRWHKTFSAQQLPAGPVRITAWAFDANTGRSYPLDGPHMIYNTTAGAH